MKTIILIVAHVTDFSHDIVMVPDDHPFVAFCETWKNFDRDEAAWIDTDEKPEHEWLITEWDKLMEDTSNRMIMPCVIDYAIHYSTY